MKELDIEGLKAFADSSAEERYYARSIKIRMATQEWMMRLADAADTEHPMPYETVDGLAIDCAMYVKKGGWDKKPGHPTTCTRWINVYKSFMGPFKLMSFGPGAFIVRWRDGYAKAEVQAELARYRRK